MVTTDNMTIKYYQKKWFKDFDPTLEKVVEDYFRATFDQEPILPNFYFSGFPIFAVKFECL